MTDVKSNYAIKDDYIEDFKKWYEIKHKYLSEFECYNLYNKWFSNGNNVLTIVTDELSEFCKKNNYIFKKSAHFICFINSNHILLSYYIRAISEIIVKNSNYC